MHFGPVWSRALFVAPPLLLALAAGASPAPAPAGGPAPSTLLDVGKARIRGTVVASARADLADGDVALLVATRQGRATPLAFALLDFTPAGGGWELAGHDELRAGTLHGSPLLELHPDVPAVTSGTLTATVGWKAEDGRSETRSFLYRRSGGRLTPLLALEPDRTGATGGGQPSVRHLASALPTSTGGIKDLRVDARECPPQGDCAAPFEVASYTFDGVRYVRRPYAIPFVETVEASSELASAGAIEDYSGGAAVDGRLETAWCEGARGPGWFQKLALGFVPAQRVKAITISTGGPRGVERGDWTRPKRVRVLLGDEGKKVEADLVDEGRPQRIALPEEDRIFGLTVVILDVYPGKREDACINELELEVEP